MPFGMWSGVGPTNHVFDGGADAPAEGAVLMAERGRPGRVWLSIY